MRRRFLPLPLLALLTALAAPLPSAAGGYRVGPGDVLDVEVTQEPKLTGTYTVSEAGTVELELLGKVSVEGKTPEEIDELLTKKLRVYFKAPTLRLSIAEYHSQKVYVLGAVAKPGPYVLEGDKNLLDVLLEAGGTTGSSLGRLVLIRADKDGGTGTSMAVELDKLLAGGVAGPSNAPVANGDVVYVPAANLGVDGAGGVVDPSGASVTVVGEVAKPGVFRLEPGATALAAVLAAGGVTKYAAPNRAKVIRAKADGRDVISLELGDILKHGERKKDIPLEPGDMVIVPARLF